MYKATNTALLPVGKEVYTDKNESYPLGSPSQLSIVDLEPFTKYTITITAMNDDGSSPNSVFMMKTAESGNLAFSLYLILIKKYILSST